MSCISDACSTCDCKTYTSQVETSILNSCDPISVVESEQINVNGEIGIWVNKCESENFVGPIPVNQYPINKDPVPQVIHKKPRCVECHRDVTIKYLEPPPIPSPGPIVINQAQNILAPAAPPVIIRQVPCKPVDPEPLVVRELPPTPPQPPSEKVITIPGDLLPPPPRKVVIERLPELPDKPQDVHIERWLPFKDIKRQIILNPKPADPVQCKPRNIIINWEKRNCCHINTDIINLGVEKTDPLVYMQTHGDTLQHESQMPEICEEVKREHGIPLGVDQCENSFYKELEGDIHALKLIDLDAEGLSDYKKYLNENCNHCDHCSNRSSPVPLNHTESSPALLQHQPCCQSSSPLPVLPNDSFSEIESDPVKVVEKPSTPEPQSQIDSSLAAVEDKVKKLEEEKPLSSESVVPDSELQQETAESSSTPAIAEQLTQIDDLTQAILLSTSIMETQLQKIEETVPIEHTVEDIPPTRQQELLTESVQVEDSAFDEASMADVTVATEFTVQSCHVDFPPSQSQVETSLVLEESQTVITEELTNTKTIQAESSVPILETTTIINEIIESPPSIVEQIQELVDVSSSLPVEETQKYQESSSVSSNIFTLSPETNETSNSPAQKTLTEVTLTTQYETSDSNQSQVEELGNYSLVVETPAATFEHSIIIESSQLEQTIVTDLGINHTFGAIEENTHNEDISIIEESVQESLFEEASIIDEQENTVNEKSILQDEASIVTEQDSITTSNTEHIVNIE